MKPLGRHYYQLDVLRALAAFSVFLFHWYGQVFHQDHLPWAGLWRDWHQAPTVSFVWLYPFSFGWIGVPLFFVISGFCIHLNWASGKNFTAAQFYWRRFWRIVPLYWLTLAFFVWRSWNSLHQESSIGGNVLSHFFFVHNLKPEWFFSICPAFWSLALELQFYLVYPLLLKWRKHWSMEKILVAALVWGIAARLVVLWFMRDLSLTQEFVFLQNTPMLWFDWLLGAVIAERATSGTRFFRYPGRSLLICGALFLLSTEFLPLSYFRYALASICMAICMEGYLRKSESPRHFERWAIPMGICSYSFYLLHQRILGSAAFHWPQSRLSGWILLGGLAFVVTLALSGISYWLLERNFLRLGGIWGRSLFGSSAKAPVPVDPLSNPVRLASLAIERSEPKQ